MITQTKPLELPAPFCVMQNPMTGFETLEEAQAQATKSAFEVPGTIYLVYKHVAGAWIRSS